jgi:hypothetical protein
MTDARISLLPNAVLVVSSIFLPSTSLSGATFQPLGHLTGAMRPYSGATAVSDVGLVVAGGSSSARGGEATMRT